MDPITLAITAALTAGATGGVTDAAKKAIVDCYEGVKALIKKKFGSQSDVTEAMEKLEAKPNSEGRKQTLAEEIKIVAGEKDQDLLSAAQKLLELVKALPGGEQHIQMAVGVGNAIADRGGVAMSNVSSWPGKGHGD